MPKPKTKALAYENGIVLDVDGGPSRTWAKSHGTYIAGRAYIDEADFTASQMEAKWGCGRLRLLVTPELREKFDRQRYLMNQAVWHGDLEAVRRESMRTVKAWMALDASAEAKGGQPRDPGCWELVTPEGRLVTILGPGTTNVDDRVWSEGRAMEVYTLEEIGRLLDGYRGLAKAKEVFPGATVTAVRPVVSDPLDAFTDSRTPIDQEIEDSIPF